MLDHIEPDPTPDPLESSWIRRQARRLLTPSLRRGMDSTDLANSVLLKEKESREGGRTTFPNRTARRGWLATVLRNLVVSESRRRPAIQWEESFENTPGSEPSPSTGLREIESNRNARDMLRVLSERDRDVVELRVVEGESFARIGEQLGIAEGHARGIFHRSLKKLRTEHDGAAER